MTRHHARDRWDCTFYFLNLLISLQKSNLERFVYAKIFKKDLYEILFMISLSTNYQYSVDAKRNE